MNGHESPRKLFADRIYRMGVENAFKIGPHIIRVESGGHKVVRLNLGEPDFDMPPFVRDEVKRQLDLGNTRYCDPQGILPLRQTIASQMKQMRGLSVSPEQIVVFPGGKPSIGFCLHAYCNSGDEVIYPSPGFPIYESFTLYLGAIPVPLHLSERNSFAFTPEQLEELITDKTRLIMLNFPSNPTGGVATVEQLRGIAEVITRRCSPDVRVYSDEIYEYILFDGRKHTSIASFPGMQERTVIASGFSKTFAWTGGRIGYAVFPTAEEAGIIKNLNIHYFSCIPPFTQEGARVAFEHPDSKKTIARMVSTFQQRRDIIVKKINEIDGIRCQIPGGAFYLYPNIADVCERIGAIDAYHRLPDGLRQSTSPSTLFQMFLLYHHYLATLDRNSFCQIGAEGQHYLRLSIASELEVLEEGVRRLKAAAEDAAGFGNFMKTLARDVI
ncbi:MAG: aminotransferase class I/II-fold pyridoxal phosphate-dependent enzyme [Acidobacteriia bacterium]|nr:aminotransferase class I/II-fold pyridoxal phosphate-dependent enzyme [Terriglobia bacterium]